MIKYFAFHGTKAIAPKPVFTEELVSETGGEYSGRMFSTVCYVILQAALWTGIVYCAIIVLGMK